MYSHLFCNFLLDNNYITLEQLMGALVEQKNTKTKLGVLAINRGLMNTEQVNRVHRIQTTIDDKFGSISVELGYLTKDQVISLLKEQKIGYLSLGQSLVNKGFITLEQLEIALDEYNKQYNISLIDFSKEQSKSILSIIENIYKFGNYKNATVIAEYVLLLFRNINRFIGSDFIPLKQYKINKIKYECLCEQQIIGHNKVTTYIEGSKQLYIEIASRYNNKKYYVLDDYVMSTVAEFLNLVNGIFCVNMSNENEIEFSLLPQNYSNSSKLIKIKDAICIPIQFSFGKMNFILNFYK